MTSPAPRLINRGLYQLALEICNYLRLAPANGEVKVLRQWALRKVSSILESLEWNPWSGILGMERAPPPPQVQDKDCPDDAVAAAIIQRLQSTSVVVSFADIARAARTEGRNRLAAQVRGGRRPSSGCLLYL